MWALICYAFVLTSEGITAWSYFEQVFERKGSRKVEIWMFILGYSLLFALSQFKNVLINTVATVYKGNIIKNLIMDCQSYTKYRPNETTGGIFVSWRRKEELPTGA